MKSIVIAFLVLGNVAILTCGYKIRPMVKRDMFETLEGIDRNAEQNKACFAIYTPQYNELTVKYETQYSGCVKTADDRKENIIKEVAGNRKSINRWQEDICSSYSNCKGYTLYPFFDCNNQAADTAITTSFSIQTMSKDRMEYVKLRNEMINYDVTVCTDKSTETYQIDSFNIRTQLQNCIQGLTTTVVPPSGN